MAANSEPAIHEEAISLHKSANSVVHNLSPFIQRLVFDEEFGGGEYVLMEMSELAIAGLEKGLTFHLKGEMNDFAVVCTEHETYEVKVRETSNKLLISPNLTTSTAGAEILEALIVGMYDSQLELRQIVPRFNRVRFLLENAPYEGEVKDSEIAETQKCTFDQLLDVVQISRTELQAMLDDAPDMCLIDGYWRVLSPKYIGILIEKVLRWLQMNSIHWNEISADDALEAMNGTEPDTVMLNIFWPKFSIMDGDILRLRTDLISRHFAAEILRNSDKMKLNEFTALWKLAVTSDNFDIEVDMKDIGGLAYTCSGPSSIPEICYLPADHMSTDPEERFRFLFRQQKLWKMSELLPYIEGVVLKGNTVERLLMKYTKKYVEAGVTYIMLGSFM